MANKVNMTRALFKWSRQKNNINNICKFIHTSSLKKETKTPLQNDYILSLDEALYLSKEMGIKTTTEVQTIIMRSPPFSADTSPFVIDNFLCNNMNNNTQNDTDETLEIDKKIEELKNAKTINDCNKNEKTKLSKDNDLLNENNLILDNKNIINKLIIKNFNLNRIKSFVHNDMEWLEESEGIGTNKRSCAYVFIKRGNGIVKINNQEDLYIRWPYFYNRMDVLEPFYLTSTECIYDVFIKLKGGGVSGQSKAARLAVGRALLNACPYIYDKLKQHDILYEDMRQKFPKMPGRKKSRAMKQWSKR
ncbi:mitochondrial ribosomal protein S9 precursor, putative [Hepatocystis sp. ex Piliocolobus tephrosceles]|nr:mitochondrial ribosomal protein S9 precursor, putative [Hepatocystis sp. ex Piliocolobus tephrosceles]